jgi:hypothetical protein
MADPGDYFEVTIQLPVTFLGYFDVVNWRSKSTEFLDERL